MADGSVCVSPGIFETKRDGGAELPHGLGEAQNHAGDHARKDQRQRDGHEDPGRSGPPAFPAACSSRVSTASIERRIARTSSGKPITAQASAAPVQRKR